MNYLSEGLSDYFFEVKPKDARTNRERYNAKGGYLGFDHAVGMLYREGDYRFFGGVVYTDYRGAVVEDSPLFKNAENTLFFIGMTFKFFKSDELER
jgi:outer membrane scaffolding protein for murein synthesis (MipA/OmpV family)